MTTQKESTRKLHHQTAPTYMSSEIIFSFETQSKDAAREVFIQEVWWNLEKLHVRSQQGCVERIPIRFQELLCHNHTVTFKEGTVTLRVLTCETSAMMCGRGTCEVPRAIVPESDSNFIRRNCETQSTYMWGVKQNVWRRHLLSSKSYCVRIIQ